MINFIELVNHVVRVAKPTRPDFNEVKDLTSSLKDCGIDSLDWLIVMIYLCEIYGIDEEQGKTMSAQNVRVIYDFLMLHKQKEPASIAEALESIK